MDVLGVIMSWSPECRKSSLLLLISTIPSVTINLNLILIVVMLSCLNADVCCELASTFKVLTWRVMPVCRSCNDCLLEDVDCAS